MQKQTQMRRSLLIGKTHDHGILRHVAEAFTPARQRTILNSHLDIGVATNMAYLNGANLCLSDRMQFNVIPRTQTIYLL